MSLQTPWGPGSGPPPQNIIHINNDMNINMIIDVHIIINMNIEDDIKYYLLFIR